MPEGEKMETKILEIFDSIIKNIKKTAAQNNMALTKIEINRIPFLLFLTIKNQEEKAENCRWNITFTTLPPEKE